MEAKKKPYEFGIDSKSCIKFYAEIDKELMEIKKRLFNKICKANLSSDEKVHLENEVNKRI